MANSLHVQVCSLCGAPMPCICERQHGYIPKALPRWRSKRFLAFVRSMPCSVPHCRETAVEAAHFGRRAVGRKVHDCLAIPLCTYHHRQSHLEGHSWEHDEDVLGWQVQTMAAAIMTGNL